MSEITVQELALKVAALELAVKSLQSGAVAAKNAGQDAPAGVSKPFSFDKLENEWADKAVKKLPSNWKGEAAVGSKFSEMSVKDLEKYAEFVEWKVGKAKADPNAKKRDDGKFFYENDEFEARLVRTWAAYRKQNPVAPEHVPGLDDDELPF